MDLRGKYGGYVKKVMSGEQVFIIEIEIKADVRIAIRVEEKY